MDKHLICPCTSKWRDETHESSTQGFTGSYVQTALTNLSRVFYNYTPTNKWTTMNTFGNHDLYYKDKRDIHSVEFGKYIPGVTVVHHPITEGDVTLCPWLVGDDVKRLKKLKGKYMFGHFELPGYLMNAMVAMPDHGEVDVKHDLAGFDHVFSGHFHKRQTKGNVTYIGNCFPHNYADAGDDDRGMMVLEWGGEPEYINWDNGPKYRVIKLSELIDKKRKIPVSTLLKAMGMSIQDIICEFYGKIKIFSTKNGWASEFDFLNISGKKLTYDLIDAETLAQVKVLNYDQFADLVLQFNRCISLK